jgi:hypothetical protein
MPLGGLRHGDGGPGGSRRSLFSAAFIEVVAPRHFADG